MAYIGFKKLKEMLSKKGIKNPGGLAAKIGRKKFGGKEFNEAAAEGNKMREIEPKKK